MGSLFTKQEMLFRTLVTEMICHDSVSDVDRRARLIDFWNHSEFYYDVFCESIYILMMNGLVQSLSIDNTGYTHFNVAPLTEGAGVGTELLSREDMPDEVDDIIVHVDVALERLQKRLASAGTRAQSDCVCMPKRGAGCIQHHMSQGHMH